MKWECQTVFGRHFRVERFSDPVLKENAWLRDLLSRWDPAGNSVGKGLEQATEGRHLRLAVRNGYLNFYRAGQSVAKVRFGRGGRPQAVVHNKYIYGDKGNGQTYVTVKTGGVPDQATSALRQYGGISELDGWIANANKHVREEKRFVDSIVSHNPDTIDLEMALPAYSELRIAPRMDLVVLEPAGDRWRIVFWEVKLVDDARARCRGDDAFPEVVDQLERYTKWLSHSNHCETVALAYQSTCRLLVALRELADRVNPGIRALGPGVLAAAAPGAPPLIVDDKPRLLIEHRNGDNRTRSLAFTEKGHLDKLRNKGIHVQMVRSLDEMTLGTRP